MTPPIGSARAGVVSEVDAIPDSGLDHFWYGPEIHSVGTYPDVEGSLDMTVTGGSPTLSDINGNQAVNYNSTDDEYHEVSDTGSLGSNGEYTAVIVCDPDDSVNDNINFQMGSDGSTFAGYNIHVDTGSNDFYKVDHTSVGNKTGGPAETGPQVIIATYDGTNVILDVNKTNKINTTLGTPDSFKSQTNIARRGDNFGNADSVIGACGHEAAFADQQRRDNLTDDLANAFDISI